VGGRTPKSGLMPPNPFEVHYNASCGPATSPGTCGGLVGSAFNTFLPTRGAPGWLEVPEVSVEGGLAMLRTRLSGDMEDPDSVYAVSAAGSLYWCGLRVVEHDRVSQRLAGTDTCGGTSTPNLSVRFQYLPTGHGRAIISVVATLPFTDRR
jgi:hypothetical protein